MNLDDERVRFEKFMREVHWLGKDELEWLSERNLYKEYIVHLAWSAWRGALEYENV